jgi:hypothetical protein
MSYVKREKALYLLTQTDPHKNPIPFSITFITADLNRNTGGEVITLEKAVLFSNHQKVRAKIQSPRLPAQLPKGGNFTPKQNSPFGGRGADTYLLVCLHTQKLYLVHTQLICEINHLPILP